MSLLPHKAYPTMFLRFITLLTVAAASSTAPMFNGKIKHVIFLMLENRSFDHMLGYQRATRDNIDGCIPSRGRACSNPVEPEQYNTSLVYVNDDAVYVQPGDPQHSVVETTLQLYGSYANNTELNYYPAPMNGFIKSYNATDNLSNDSGSFIMQCFNPSTLPIINTLASEFATIDRWFAAVPGPTCPNRIFSMMATSQGMAENNHPKLAAGFVGHNIFKMLDEAVTTSSTLQDTLSSNLAWLTYMHDAPTSGFIEYVRTRAWRARDIDMLHRDIRNGSLPLLSWVDPGYFDIDALHQATDQHPDHDVTKGEKLIKEIYESLRASERWNDTLFVITYDEHGGFFDHVSPPSAVNPDGKNSTHLDPPQFAFDRLGVRVPTVLVSPWIKKGTVGKVMKQDEPQYSHSSFVRTLREQFAPDYPAFTKRDAAALAFDDLVNLEEMRTDCLEELPDVPTSSYADVDWLPGQQENHDYQIDIARSVAAMCGRQSELGAHLDNQASLGQFVKNCVAEWRSL